MIVSLPRRMVTKSLDAFARLGRFRRWVSYADIDAGSSGENQFYGNSRAWQCVCLTTLILLIHILECA